MKPYQWIVGLALLPRALHTAWISLVVLGVLLWVVMPATCSALVSSSPVPAVDAGTLEQAIEEKTAQLAPSVLEYGPPPPERVCFSSDVQRYCCGSACAVKNSPKWERANDVLRACMRGIGCSDSESKGATVGLRCDCKAKP